MKIHHISAAALAAILGAAAPALAQSQPTPASTEVVTIPGVGTANILSYKVQFVSANPATRQVVLETPAGLRWAVVAPPLVGDLTYFRNGETLLIRKLPGTVTAIGKAAKGQPGEVLKEAVIDAGPPGWPEGFGIREVTVVAPVVSTNPADGTVSFPGPDGYLRTLRVGNDAALSSLSMVQPGRPAEISYIEGLSINAMR